MKESFLVFTENKEILDALNDDQAGILFKNLMRYQMSDELLNMDSITNIAFIAFRKQIDKSNAKYEATCEKRRIAGAAGGKANASKRKQKEANQADNDNDNENDYDNDNERERVRENASHSPPSLEQIRQYCLDNGLTVVDPEKFFDYYEGTHWHAGRSPIQWQKKIREWDREDKRSKTGKWPSSAARYEGRNVDYNEIGNAIMAMQRPLSEGLT